MLKLIFIALIVVHGLIHLMGAAKAFGWADVNAIQHPMTKLDGAAWLITTLLFVASAVLLATGSHSWWIPASFALVLSQIAIIGAWSDARFGTIANVIIFVPVALAIFDLRPSSVRSQFVDKVAARTQGDDHRGW